MNTIKFRYFVTAPGFSEAVRSADDALAKDVEACEAYAKSLGAVSVLGNESFQNFYPSHLLFDKRFPNEEMPNWLCGEEQNETRWAYKPNRSTKRGREIYERLLGLVHKTCQQRYHELVGLGGYWVIGLYDFRVAYSVPAVFPGKDKDVLCIRMPLTSGDETGIPPQLQAVRGIKEIKRWEFMKETEAEE